LIKSIVGIEIVITRLVGKWKASQNQPERNQAGVVEGLRGAGSQEASQMAALVEAGAKKHLGESAPSN
jgi:transcriptional regulator